MSPYPKQMRISSLSRAELGFLVGTLDASQFVPPNHFLISEEFYGISRFVMKLLCIYNRGSFRGCCFIYEPNVYKKCDYHHINCHYGKRNFGVFLGGNLCDRIPVTPKSLDSSGSPW